MALTPEGKVKREIKKVLDSYGEALYQYWPVPAGYGAQSLDCIGCYRGLLFAVEAKAKGKKPTGRQNLTIQAMGMAGAVVFVIDGMEGVNTLREWLDSV